jgi:acid phosphatase family membrane protein YuiD
MLIAAFKKKTFDFEYLVSTGGMPSAHTSMVTALTVSVGLTEGFGSPIAMVALGFASVTMFDAATVRRAAGEQAKVLNRIVKEWRQERHLPSAANLKEPLGHTRTEVFGGMATGIATATAVCRLWN